MVMSGRVCVPVCVSVGSVYFCVTGLTRASYRTTYTLSCRLKQTSIHGYVVMITELPCVQLLSAVTVSLFHHLSDNLVVFLQPDA